MRASSLLPRRLMRSSRIRVDHNQDSAQRVYADRDVTLFLRIVLGHCHGPIVIEDGGRIGEVNPMFSQVRPRLALVPLKPHSPAHMHKRT